MDHFPSDRTRFERPRRILLTGASGLIGTHLGLRLLDAGNEVIGIDIRPNPWTDRIPTILCDLAHPESSRYLHEFLDPGIDLVVHLAAFAKVHLSVCSPESSLQNVQMVHTVLELCRTKGVPLIYSSSREVYGDRPDCEQVEESFADFTRVASPYAAGKMAAEAFIYSYARCFGLRYLVFRFSNVYGPYDNELDRMERVIPLFIDRIERGEPITIFGPEKVLDFTYIDDCIDGIMRGVELMLGGGSACRTVNIARGEGHSLPELVGLIERVVGRRADVQIEGRQTGEITRYVADISEARSLLGYDPQVSLAEGIERTVAWWQEHVRGKAPVHAPHPESADYSPPKQSL